MFEVIYTKYLNTEEKNTTYQFPTYDEAYAKACELGKDTTTGIPLIKKEDQTLQYLPVDFKDYDGNEYLQVTPSIFNITLFPEKLLLTPSIPFTKDEIQREDFKQLIFSMFMTMYISNGIGLAAPQIGLNRQLFVMDTQIYLTGVARPRVFINPHITEFEGIQEGIEGCLSSPGLQAKMARPEEVTIDALDVKGEMFTLCGYGLDAACLTHEVEHLMGKTIASKASNYERGKYLKKYKKAKRQVHNIITARRA